MILGTSAWLIIAGIFCGALPMVLLVQWQGQTIRELKRKLFDLENPNDRDINPFDDIPEPWDD